MLKKSGFAVIELILLLTILAGIAATTKTALDVQDLRSNAATGSCIGIYCDSGMKCVGGKCVPVNPITSKAPLPQNNPPTNSPTKPISLLDCTTEGGSCVAAGIICSGGIIPKTNCTGGKLCSVGCPGSSPTPAPIKPAVSKINVCDQKGGYCTRSTINCSYKDDPAGNDYCQNNNLGNKCCLNAPTINPFEPDRTIINIFGKQCADETQKSIKYTNSGDEIPCCKGLNRIDCNIEGNIEKCSCSQSPLANITGTAGTDPGICADSNKTFHSIITNVLCVCTCPSCSLFERINKIDCPAIPSQFISGGSQNPISRIGCEEGKIPVDGCCSDGKFCREEKSFLGLGPITYACKLDKWFNWQKFGVEAELSCDPKNPYNLANLPALPSPKLNPSISPIIRPPNPFLKSCTKPSDCPSNYCNPKKVCDINPDLITKYLNGQNIQGYLPLDQNSNNLILKVIDRMANNNEYCRFFGSGQYPENDKKCLEGIAIAVSMAFGTVVVGEVVVPGIPAVANAIYDTALYSYSYASTFHLPTWVVPAVEIGGTLGPYAYYQNQCNGGSNYEACEMAQNIALGAIVGYQISTFSNPAYLLPEEKLAIANEITLTQLKQEGVTVKIISQQELQKMIQNGDLNLSLPEIVPGGWYSSGTREIVIIKPYDTPAVLSHELGHAIRDINGQRNVLKEYVETVVPKLNPVAQQRIRTTLEEVGNISDNLARLRQYGVIDANEEAYFQYNIRAYLDALKDLDKPPPQLVLPNIPLINKDGTILTPEKLGLIQNPANTILTINEPSYIGQIYLPNETHDYTQLTFPNGGEFIQVWYQNQTP